jgi:DNA invertase Pin-like site-specific DNA recombinase
VSASDRCTRPIDTTTAGGRLVFHIFAALAEFIRELIVEGTHEGLAAAKARGVRLGRPPANIGTETYVKTRTSADYRPEFPGGGRKTVGDN